MQQLTSKSLHMKSRIYIKAILLITMAFSISLGLVSCGGEEDRIALRPTTPELKMVPVTIIERVRSGSSTGYPERMTKRYEYAYNDRLQITAVSITVEEPYYRNTEEIYEYDDQGKIKWSKSETTGNSNDSNETNYTYELSKVNVSISGYEPRPYYFDDNGFPTYYDVVEDRNTKSVIFSYDNSYNLVKTEQKDIEKTLEEYNTYRTITNITYSSFYSPWAAVATPRWAIYYNQLTRPQGFGNALGLNLPIKSVEENISQTSSQISEDGGRRTYVLKVNQSLNNYPTEMMFTNEPANATEAHFQKIYTYHITYKVVD